MTGHLLHRRPGIEDIQKLFTGSPSTNTAPFNNDAATTSSSSVYTSESTLLQTTTPPASPSTPAPSHHFWANTKVDPRLRTWGGMPWHIPGDNGEGYATPVTISDLDGSLVLAGVHVESPASLHAAIDEEATANRCLLPGLCQVCNTIKRIIKSTQSKLSDLFRCQRSKLAPYTVHSPEAIAQRLADYSDLELLLIDLHSRDAESATDFMRWFLGFYDIRKASHDGSVRVKIGDARHTRLSHRAKPFAMAVDLETGAVWVEGDGDGGEIAQSLIDTLVQMAG